jgi:hypothetical protein
MSSAEERWAMANHLELEGIVTKEAESGWAWQLVTPDGHVATVRTVQ